jgi:hypothetical protein
MISDDITDWTTEADVGMLFRRDEHETAHTLFSTFLAPICGPSPSENGTKASFIAFWDNNIRRVLERIVPRGTAIRSSKQTSTSSMRPDFGFLLGQVCAFRGEEKSPSNADDPRAELSAKLTWTYDPAPYVLGLLVTFVNLPTLSHVLLT